MLPIIPGILKLEKEINWDGRRWFVEIWDDVRQSKKERNWKRMFKKKKEEEV